MNLFFKIILIAFLSSLIQIIQAQSPAYIDSLETEVDNKQDLSEKTLILSKLAYLHIQSNPYKALGYHHRVLKLLPKDSLLLRGDTYNAMGAAYANMDSTLVAINYMNKALNIFKRINEPERVATANNHIAYCYLLLEQYKPALEYSYQALEVYDSINQPGALRNIYTLQMSINLAQKDLKSALNNAKQALSADEIYDGKISSVSLFNVGLVYMEQKLLDSAAYYIEYALKVNKVNEDKTNLATNLGVLADIYIQQDKIDLANKHITQAIELEEHIHLASPKIYNRISLAKVLFAKKKYRESITTYNNVIALTDQDFFPNYYAQALEGLAKNHAALNNFELAYQTLLKVAPLKDSVLNQTKIKEIKNLEIKYQTKYESKKKEQVNLLLSKDLSIQTLKAARGQQKLYGIAALLVLSLIIFSLLIRQYRSSANQKMLQLKHQLLRNQMSPHFIFNALIAIQGFVYKNNPQKAGKYLSSFAKLIRAILENSRTEYISLSKEIQWLENYLNLQLLRFNHKFNFNLNIDEEIDIESLLIPPMLTQPFIENALEHGIKNIDYPGVLDIEFSLKEDLLVIKIQDNGVGLNPKKTADSKHISLATKITKERLDFLNKNNSKKINFDISSILPFGTLVSFAIPIKYIY